MQRCVLRSKIRGGTLTGTQLEYEGSIAIDRDVLDAADLLCGEQVHVLNVNNGARLVTYVIEAPAGSSCSSSTRVSTQSPGPPSHSTCRSIFTITR